MILRCCDGEAWLYNGGYERPFKCHLTAAEPEQNVNMWHTHAHTRTQTFVSSHTLTGHRNLKDLNNFSNFSIVLPTQQWERIIETSVALDVSPEKKT